MNSRIVDIVNLVGCDGRYLNCNDKMNLDYIKGLGKIEYDTDMPNLDTLKVVSKKFFEKILAACREN